MVRGCKPQIRAMRDPIPHVNVKAFPSSDHLFDPSRRVGMTQDNDLKSLQKFLVCKGLKGREKVLGFTGVIDLAALVAHLQGNPTAPRRTHPLNEMIHPSVFDDPPEESIFPLVGIR
jgi:hypothetical protein